MLPRHRATLGPAAPSECDGVAICGSWRQTVNNFHSTTLIYVGTVRNEMYTRFEPGAFLLLMINRCRHLQSTRSSPESALPCMRDDVTKVDEC